MKALRLLAEWVRLFVEIIWGKVFIHTHIYTLHTHKEASGICRWSVAFNKKEENKAERDSELKWLRFTLPRFHLLYEILLVFRIGRGRVQITSISTWWPTDYCLDSAAAAVFFLNLLSVHFHFHSTNPVRQTRRDVKKNKKKVDNNSGNVWLWTLQVEVLGGGSGANSSEKLISDYTTTMMVICLGGYLGLRMKTATGHSDRYFKLN